MCQFCFNSDNGKRKFRLFDINSIPLIAPFKSRRCFDTLLGSEKSSSYHSVVNSSNNFAEVTKEIRELLYAYQLLHLCTVLFLKAFILKAL